MSPLGSGLVGYLYPHWWPVGSEIGALVAVVTGHHVMGQSRGSRPEISCLDEVSSSDYSTCTVGNEIRSDKSGATTITLKTAGTIYFICGVPGHCADGMKLAIKVESGGSTSTTTTTTTNSYSSSAIPNRSPFAAFFTTWVALLVILIINISFWQEF
ncbi:Blue copper protein [Hibiscus syriacus]|uniref:Blue copper protein n=1 Tax=Hibiscus syriacus TaxID=106335 RepID=A0A6A2X2L7_HIBSY|nr:Blue copper protein [Hibiscus syriacus]